MKNLLAFMLLLISIQFCSTMGQTAERRLFYMGVRGMSMGGATAATVNDETALLLNPAALGKLRDFYGTILDPEIELSQGNLTAYTAQPFGGYYDLNSVKDTLNVTRETHYHSKYQVFPSFVGRNFGIGIFASKILDAEMAADGASMSSYYRDDMALVLGYNFRFFEGRIKFGFNTKVLNRIEYDESAIPITDITQTIDLTPYYKEGTGVSFDGGLILTAPWVFLPTISCVVHDVGGTRFDKSSGQRMTTTSRPTELKQDADVAVALFPINGKVVRTVWTLQYDSLLLGSTETDKAKLIHAGFEMNFRDILFLRAGYNQRYFTGGVELATERFQFQLGSYGVEIGTADAPREDHRYVIKMALRY